MIWNVKGNLRYGALTKTATIALIAGGSLVMSGITAAPAAGESSVAAHEKGEVIQDRPDPQDEETYQEEANGTDGGAEEKADSEAYEDGKSSGITVPEKFNRFTAMLGVGYRVTQKLSTSLNYAYSIRHSDQAFRGYYQNTLSLNVGYSF